MKYTIILCALTLGLSACGNNANDNNATNNGNNTNNAMDMAQDMVQDQSPDQDTKDMVPDLDMSENEPLTYHKDIQPILHDHCTRCHYNGGQGPGDFTNPEVVDGLAKVMLKAIDDKRMPPPVADPDCRDYQSAERMVLPAAKRDKLAKWIEEGQQRGTPVAGAPTGPPQEAVLNNPDLELRLSQPYKPTYSDGNNPNNEYRCFVLDPKHTETFFITDMHPIVDKSEIVHHVVLAKNKKANLPAEIFEPTGVDCIDNMSVLGGSIDSGMIGAWAPGMEPVSFDNGGLKVDPGDVLVIQMHYYNNGDTTLEDQSGYALKTATSVANEIRMAPLGPTGFKIPPNEEAHTITEEISLPVNITLWGVFPHMHVLGRSYSMKLKGSEEMCLLEGQNYDFNNQLTYIYKEPVFIRKNTPVEFSCTWNNSMSNPALIHKPPIEVKYGERTDEEMCYAFSYISLGQKK